MMPLRLERYGKPLGNCVFSPAQQGIDARLELNRAAIYRSDGEGRVVVPAKNVHGKECLGLLEDDEAAWGLTNTEIPLVAKPGQSMTNMAEKVA